VGLKGFYNATLAEERRHITQAMVSECWQNRWYKLCANHVRTTGTQCCTY